MRAPETGGMGGTPKTTTTLFAQSAHDAASSDRDACADRILCAGVEDALHLIRQGRAGKAEFVLTRAGISAERILGRAS